MRSSQLNIQWSVAFYYSLDLGHSLSETKIKTLNNLIIS